MNSITVAGRLGRDAEQRFLNNGDPVLSFSVADDQYKGDAIFWRCSLFGKRAESLAPFMKKGASVTITGTVSEREHDGKKYFDVRVSDVALQGGKPDSAAPAAQASKAPPAKKSVPPWDDEDIPL